MLDARCEEWAFRYFTAYCILQSANRLLPTAQPQRGVTTVDQEGRCEERDRDRGKEGRGTRKCGERRGARCEVKGSVGIKLHTEYRKPPTANRPAPEGPNMSDNEHPTSTQPRRGVTTVDYEGGTWGEGRGARKSRCVMRGLPAEALTQAGTGKGGTRNEERDRDRGKKMRGARSV